MPRVHSEGDGTQQGLRASQDSLQKEAIGSVYLPPAPDGGWGWVVVMASFFCNSIVDGIIFSFGIFLPRLQQQFQEGTSTISWIGSLLSGFYLMAGPFVSALASRFDFRIICAAGSLVACASFVVSSFSRNITLLYVFFGVLGGIGFGMIYVPSVVACSFYFEKKRALATGIAVSGSGFGTFIFAPLTTKLIEVYSWRGAILLHAGFILHCCVFGALFRPPPSASPPLLRAELLSGGSPSSSVDGGSPSPPVDGARRRSSSSVVVAAETARGLGDAGALWKVVPRRRLRYTSECFPGSFDGLDARPSKEQEGSALVTVRGSRRAAQRRLSEPPWCQGLPPPPPSRLSRHLPTVKEESETLVNGKDAASAPGVGGHPVPERACWSGARNRSFCTDRRTFSHANSLMERDDVFYSGSLLRLSDLGSSLNVDATVSPCTSLLHLPAATAAAPPLPPVRSSDAADGAQPCLRWCEMGEVIARMLDVSLFRSPTFLLLCLSGMSMMMGVFVPFIFLTDRLLTAGYDKEAAASVLSAVGVTNTVGRLVCGWISDRPWSNVLLVNNTALALAGVMTVACPHLHDFYALILYAVVFGFGLACFASLRSIIIVEFLGLEKLTNAFGLTLLFQGIAACVGSPVAGYFYDLTKSYNTTFYIAGVLITLSSVLTCPLNYVSRREKRGRRGSGSLCARAIPADWEETSVSCL